eukprot:COSAG03_NODE_25281_length_266_cov_1.544910_1_plen_64_part_10
MYCRLKEYKDLFHLYVEMTEKARSVCMAHLSKRQLAFLCAAEVCVPSRLLLKPTAQQVLNSVRH